MSALDIHIGDIQARHAIEDAPFTDYIWGEHLVDEGIVRWVTRTNLKTGEEEKVLDLVDMNDTSTHRRVAGEWITQNVLRHPLLAGDIMANSYKVKVILYCAGGVKQLGFDFTSSWSRLIGNSMMLYISFYDRDTGEYRKEVHWP